MGLVPRPLAPGNLFWPPFRKHVFLHAGTKDEASSLKDRLHPWELKGKFKMVLKSSLFSVLT